jgi:adenylosuccinate synthase
MLARAHPDLEELPVRSAADFIRRVEELAALPVLLAGTGPTSNDLAEPGSWR